jgi:methionine-rich copper-binding protein CopC
MFNSLVRVTRSVSSIIGLPMLLAASPLNAIAHAVLVTTDPARRATIAHAPKAVKLCFNEAIEMAYTTVSVLDASNSPVSNAKPQGDPGDTKCVSLVIPNLADGRYTVKYRVLSVDGHVVESSYEFSVKGDALQK